MPEVKKNHIAVTIGKNGCEHIAKVKVVNDQELAKLNNELEYNESKRQDKENEHLLEHKVIADRIAFFNHCIAKSIYDNFVDRGLIENDEEFQKKWFDFFFNDGEPFDVCDTPEEFQKILEKVENVL